MNEMMLDTRLILGTYFRDSGGAPENRPQIALESDEDRAIDLSCRACGALALGAGLGFPVGVSAPLRFPPPTSDHIACEHTCTYKTKIKLDKEVGGGFLSKMMDVNGLLGS